MEKINSSVKASLETKKAWSTPKLQKIDIEQITAASAGPNFDGPGTASS
jgi:hypothetical protein